MSWASGPGLDGSGRRPVVAPGGAVPLVGEQLFDCVRDAGANFTLRCVDIQRVEAVEQHDLGEHPGSVLSLRGPQPRIRGVGVDASHRLRQQEAARLPAFNGFLPAAGQYPARYEIGRTELL